MDTIYLIFVTSVPLWFPKLCDLCAFVVNPPSCSLCLCGSKSPFVFFVVQNPPSCGYLSQIEAL